MSTNNKDSDPNNEIFDLKSENTSKSDSVVDSDENQEEIDRDRETFSEPRLGKVRLERSSPYDHLKKKWYKDIAINLRNYGYESAGYSWMHDRDAIYYNSLLRKLTLASALLSTITTSGITAIISLIETKVLWLLYALSGLSIAISLAGAIISVWILNNNYNLKIKEHSEKSAKFGKLYRKIKNQFSLYPNHRYDAKTLLDYTTERFNELDRERPFIRSSTQKKWEEQVELNEKGDILYDKILPLPSEFLSDDDSCNLDNDRVKKIGNNTFVRIDNDNLKKAKTTSVNKWIKNRL